MSKRSKSSKRWHFTLHNPNVGDYGDMFSTGGYVKFAFWQVVRGDFVTVEGYVETNKPASLSRMDRLIPNAFWEMLHVSQTVAIAHLQNQKNRIQGPWTIGEKTRQGQRNDLLTFNDPVTNDTVQQLEDEPVLHVVPGTYSLEEGVLHYEEPQFHSSRELFKDKISSIGTLQADIAQEFLESEDFEEPEFPPSDEEETDYLDTDKFYFY